MRGVNAAKVKMGDEQGDLMLEIFKFFAESKSQTSEASTDISKIIMKTKNSQPVIIIGNGSNDLRIPLVPFESRKAAEELLFF